MSNAPDRERFSLKRWSERKHAAVREAARPPEPAVAPTASPAPAVAATSAAPPVAPAEPLPPVETLTFDADFTRYMAPDVDPSLKRAALKKLFSDPRFNVMDGLDVYIDDYSKPDPIDAETVKQLAAWKYLSDPPKTRVNERGEVEDVPPEAEAAPDAHPTPAVAEAPPAALPTARDESAPPSVPASNEGEEPA